MAATESSLRDYGIAAPHGPNMAGDHVATRDFHEMNPNEKGVFDFLLKPDDSFDSSGKYWADMGIMERIRFVSSVDKAEAKKETNEFWSMFKTSASRFSGILAPIGWIMGAFTLWSYYFKNCIIPGMGLLLEGYVLFSIGNVRPLLEDTFGTCWKTYEICDKTWTQAIDYLEICGIIVGQILVGIIGDWLGRRWGLIQDAVIMFVGLVMLTAAWGLTQNGWIICYVWALFFYGIGVGGEYPMTATSGMENAVGSGKVSTKEDRLHRGRKVTSAFLMQGWGQFINVVILMVLLRITHGYSGPPYAKSDAQWTYRVSFFIPAVGTLWLVFYRAYKMKSAGKQLAMQKKKQHITGYDTESLKLTFTYFGPRLIATAGAWFANDVFFYGNKLFQSQFIKVITTSKDVMVTWEYNLINVAVSLVGYYAASFLIDNKLYGRKWMMIVGFMLDFILFVIPAFNYEYYTSPEHIHEFQAMYFLSSFFNQFGPNSVTFLVAAEVFPTPIRATAHGFSAAMGKLGALLAAVLYNYIDTQTKFYVVPWFGLAGALMTWLFLPDTTGLDLKEQERRWTFIRAGREQDYHGIAIHPKHLSVWERIRGVGKNYDADADYKQRVEEMRGDWEEWQQRKFEEEAKGNGYDLGDDEFGEDISSYFTRTARSTPMPTPQISTLEKQQKATSPRIQANSSESENEKLEI
ncbi:putative inorganic phosphate transporter C23D3.12 [Lasiodiplodia hormozganensis]|uniref:Inorganic phosphate transporter C23D3.12 n=1 Tax=Lasiodiplodia hormozganensis TaxID=869390 RepID=A0AA40CTV8_9PEZI|nr:putative inorganic phosphate transporter C23D3.12 [Lasiodiplodia hormozganensis]